MRSVTLEEPSTKTSALPLLLQSRITGASDKGSTDKPSVTRDSLVRLLQNTETYQEDMLQNFTGNLYLLDAMATVMCSSYNNGAGSSSSM